MEVDGQTDGEIHRQADRHIEKQAKKVLDEFPD